jgi:hypothetical protein
MSLADRPLLKAWIVDQIGHNRIDSSASRK